MDSLTQILLGSSVAALVVPHRHRRQALLAGALLGTLPDLDSLPLMLLDDPVLEMTWHRGPSHSLLVLPLLGWLIWCLLRRWWTPVRNEAWRWAWAIQLTLLTHPLLDAFTVYGTQLLWPLPMRPVMWSSVFIIDPAYSLPLLFGVLIALIAGGRRLARGALLAGLLLSTSYLGWSLLAKAIVEHHAQQALAPLGLADAPRFSVPTPFNTLLWNVVAMTPDGYVVAQRSLVADDGPMQFEQHRSEVDALAAVRQFPAVERLLWFNHGFVRASIEGDRLLLSDLRMGLEPDYVFTFAVARRVDGSWKPIEPEHIETSLPVRERIDGLWARIWSEPPAAPDG